MHADRRIGRARPARHKGTAGSPGQRAIRTSHERDAPFLAADNIFDLRRIMQGIEHGEEAFAGNREDPVAPLDHKLIDKNAATSARCVLGHDAALIASLQSWKHSKAIRLRGGSTTS